MATDPEAALERVRQIERERRNERLREIEDQIFYKSAALVEAHMDHFEVSPDQEEPPPAWVERYGADAARQRLKVAKTGWLPKRDCPSGVDLAGKFLIGSVRARAYRQANPVQQNLNVKINLPAPTSKDHPTLEAEGYPIKELEE